MAGSTITGLLTVGAVAGGAAIGSLTGFLKRPAEGLEDTAGAAEDASEA